MAEEQNWEETSNHTLCAGNCGFFGNPTTLNMCSKCYENHQQMSTAKLAVEKSLSLPTNQPETSSASSSDVVTDHLVVVNKVTNSVPDPVAVKAQPPRNRCGSCKRRVGLTGFTCRCGMTFCGTHRYAEMHACTFDYKAMGKEAIAKANPVIKGEKLNKI